mmetsp:Transcript_16642/g.32255  ORF Transcript_16642/g.32255 Transcript_16642/m.32255 type:complete len:206 (+) Transcript_16642:2233-2850(+)
MNTSSSLVHASLRISGSRWFRYLSLHCLADLPGMYLAAYPQFFMCGFFATISSSRLSSSVVHLPLITSGLSDLFHLCKHCTCDLPGTSVAITFHCCPLCFFTALFSSSSSSGVHRLLSVLPCFEPCDPPSSSSPGLLVSLLICSRISPSGGSEAAEGLSASLIIPTFSTKPHSSLSASSPSSPLSSGTAITAPRRTVRRAACWCC